MLLYDSWMFHLGDESDWKVRLFDTLFDTSFANHLVPTPGFNCSKILQDKFTQLGFMDLAQLDPIQYHHHH